jgi:hypothetical protein
MIIHEEAFQNESAQTLHISEKKSLLYNKKDKSNNRASAIPIPGGSKLEVNTP